MESWPLFLIAAAALLALWSFTMRSAAFWYYRWYRLIGVVPFIYLALRSGLGGRLSWLDGLLTLLLPFVFMSGSLKVNWGRQKTNLQGAIVVVMPPRMRDDESASVRATFAPLTIFETNAVVLRDLVLPIPSTLSVSLQAAGFEVIGPEPKSVAFKKDPTSPDRRNPYATFHWNIKPESAGEFDVSVLVTVTGPKQPIVHQSPLHIRVLTGMNKRLMVSLKTLLLIIGTAAAVGGFILNYRKP
jgi:hypothetical protein